MTVSTGSPPRCVVERSVHNSEKSPEFWLPWPGSPLPGKGYVPGKRIDTENFYPKRRRSASADAALRAEIQRVEKMTIEERIRAALSLAERFSSMEGTHHKREKCSFHPGCLLQQSGATCRSYRVHGWEKVMEELSSPGR